MKTFSPFLDQISENIIYLKSINSKVSTSQLAKTLGISRKIVAKRVQTLYDKGHIKSLLIYNYKNLIKATILIKLSKFDKITTQSLVKLKKIIKVKETLGSYDFSLLVIVNKRQDLDDIMSKIHRLFHTRIQNMEFIIHELEDTMGYKSFCHDYKFLSKYNLLNPDIKYIFTLNDKRVMQYLIEKPMISYTELMYKTNLSFNKIKSIIKNLIDRDIIRMSVDPQYDKLGLEFHNVLLRVDLGKRKLFEKNLKNMPRVHWIKKGLGSWNYILSIASKDINEFINITREIRTENKDILYDFSVLISKISVVRKV